MNAVGTGRLRKALAVTAFLLACLVALLALPPIQRIIARAVANGAGVDLEIGYVWAGPRGVDASNVRVVIPGLTLSVERVDLDIAFWSSLTHAGLDVRRAAVRGVDVRVEPATQPASDEPVSAPANQPFAGLRPFAQLPRWLMLRELSVAGEVALVLANGVDITGPWQVAAKGFAASSLASLQVEATLEARRAGELLALGRFDTSTTARIDPESRITNIAADTDLRPADDQRTVHMSAVVGLEALVEHYTIDVTHAAGAELVHLDALLDPGVDLAASWQANVTPGVVAAFARGRSVADLSGTSTGEARIDLASRQTTIKASTRVDGRGWDAFDPRLVDWGALAVTSEVDLTVGAGIVDVRTVALGLVSAARGDLLHVTSLQRLRFDTATWLVDPETWGVPALRVQALKIPLGWLRQFSPARNLEGGELSGTLEVVREEARRTTLIATDPLRLSGVSVQPVRDLAIPPFDVTIKPRVTVSNGTLDAQIEDLTIAADTGFRLRFRGRGTTSRTEWPRATFDGDLTARLPRVQKIVPQLDALRAVTHLQFDFETLELGIAAANVSATSRDGRKLVSADLSGQQPLRVTLPALAADWDGTDPQSISLRIDRLPLDWASAFIPELGLSGGEMSGQFTASGGLGRGLVFETHEPLVIENLVPLYRGRVFSGKLTASVRPRLTLGTSASSFALEDIRFRTAGGDELRGEVVVDAPAGNERVTVSASLDGAFPSLVRDYGARVGALHWRQRGELDPERRRYTLQELAVTFSDSDGTAILDLRNMRPFSFTSQPFAVAVDGGSTDILRVVVTPLRLERLLPNLLGFDLEGVLPQGEFFGRVAPDGGLVLAADEPLVFRDVTVRWGDATLLDRVTAGVQYAVAYSAAGIEARSVDLTATGADGEKLVHVAAEVSAPLTKERLLDMAHISAEAYLAPLMGQPALADLPPFTAGELRASLDFVHAAETTIALRAELRDAATEQGSLPDLSVGMNAEGVYGERVKLTLPVQMQSQEFGKSALLFQGTSTTDAQGVRTVDAALTGERFALADLRRIVDLVAPDPSAAPAAGTPAVTSSERATAIAKLRTERHSMPVWTDRLRATATIDVGSLVLRSGTVQGLHGALSIAPERVAVTGLRASLFGAELDVDTSIAFDARAPKPYALDFHASIDDFDLKQLFLAVAPDDPTPTAEGLFDFDSTLAGTGLNPIDLGLSALGEIRLTGRNGIFRGLEASAGTGSKAANVIGFLTFSKEFRAVGRLVDGIGTMRFEEAEFLLSRATLERIELRNLFVLAPQLRIDATGAIELAPERPLLLSPLDVSARLAARGDVAILFDGMQLLETGAGNAGYRELNQRIAIGGSPAEPDTSAFWSLLDEGAGNARGSFGLALRTLNRQLEKASRADAR